jgi:oxygen-independent coproporphyrinogen-3 oxidase
MTFSAALLSTRVPRYTSYPTAPHFHAGIGSAVYRSWLENLPPESSLSLYVHVPFCDTLCWFCGCHTRVANRYSPVEDYLVWLTREIDMVAGALGSGRRVTHIHWGGGSPTLLAPNDILRLAYSLRARFDVAPDCEFAVEIDPRDLRDETIAALRTAGVNRASIGVQDCDDKVQRAINRIQPPSVTQSAVERLRAASIHAINFDVMYGLPYQTVAHVQRTIEATLSLSPQRYAVFGYAHVPGFKKHQELIPMEALPDSDERLAQSDAAGRTLAHAGYVPIGLDHFARPEDPLAIAARGGTLRRNFQGYTTDAALALIGFGASAIGALPQGYAQNASDVPSWRRTLATGALPIARGIALSREDRARRAIIEQLMCNLEADTGAIAAEHGYPKEKFAPELVALMPYAQNGIVALHEYHVRVTPENGTFVRVIGAVFDAYLPNGSAKHSVAV